MNEDQIILELERLLGRLYSPVCSNQERVELSKILEDFSQNENVLKHCVHLVQNSSNDYSILYGLNVIESVIVHSWSTLSNDDKVIVKQFVSEYLISKFSVLPSFFRNKLVHLFVLIGRSDWPHSDPDFLKNILQLGKSEGNTLLCCCLLKATSEELATPKADALSSKRQKELTSLLFNCVPSIVGLLVDILKAGLWLQPSLSTPQSASKAIQLDLIFKLHLPYEVLHSALGCLCHYFTWVPLSIGLVPDLLDIIFKYASLGCISAVDGTGGCGELSAAAMDCINELLLKNFVPKDLEFFFINLFEKAFILLQQLTAGEGEKDFAGLDDRFLSKCGDFFDYFISSHLKRIEFNPNFPVVEFFVLFYKYTFKQPETDSFCVCLVTWGVFLDHLLLSNETKNMSGPAKNNIDRYKEILITLVKSILEKIQFHYNGLELGNIDDDTINENETEWQSFVRQNLEVVGKVSELYPLEVLQMIIPLFEQYCEVYLSLSQLITYQGQDRVLAVSAGEQCSNVHAILKDLTTLLQTLGRLAEQFCGDNFTCRLEDTHKLMNKFLIVAKYSTDNTLFNVETSFPELLEQGFIEIHCQVFGTLKAYFQWIDQFYQAVLAGRLGQEALDYFVFSAFESSLPLLSCNVPEKISLSACKVFESIASTVRSSFVFEHCLVQELLLQTKKGLNLPLSVSIALYKGLLYMLVIPWRNVSDDSQNWDGRFSELQALLATLINPYCQYIATTRVQQASHIDHEQGKLVIKRTLVILQELISSLSNENKKSKGLLYQSIKVCVLQSIPLLHTYSNESDVLEQLMNFFYTLFKHFRSQIEPGLTNEVTQTFMAFLSKDQLESTVFVEGTIGYNVIIRFIDILKLLVKSIGSSEENFFPDIVSFALKQLYPALKHKNAPDVKVSFYSLLFHLLLDNWRYFYPANVLAQLDDTNLENVEHEQELLAIMEAFGQSFVQSDILVFRENILALKALNQARKLFFKTNFLSTMWGPFLDILLQVLMLKSHDLLLDEISELIYELASVNFMKFCTEFFPKFIGNFMGLTQEQKLSLVKDYQIAEDYPSFTQNLKQLIVDVRFHLFHNKAGATSLSTMPLQT